MSLPPLYLGIDPGLGGALACVQPGSDVDPKPHISVHDMPTFTITVNQKPRRQLDLVKVNELFDRMDGLVTHAGIEEPHALPGQGVTSAFSFGFVCGVLQMVCAAYRIPVTLVRPATWKAQMRLTADKDACRKRASQLFPTAAELWARKQDDGRAEAVLLAWWGLRGAGML